MISNLSFLSGVRAACVAVVAFLLTCASAEAVDLSGEYDDGGTIASGAELVGGEPSLHAILARVFDPKLAAMLRDQSSTVRFKHSTDVLEIEALNRDGEVSWRSAWRKGEGYVERGTGVLIRFPADRTGGDETLLTLENVAENRLLQVTVQRVKPTLLGPMVQQRGVYLFPRAP